MIPKQWLQSGNRRLLLILGAPKCGTGSLFDYLSAHPNIVPSQPKETFGLIDDHSPFATVADRALLNGAVSQMTRDMARSISCTEVSESSYLLEATTHHVYSELAAANIKPIRRNVRGIILIRRHADRIFSSFRYSKNNLGRVNPNYSFQEYVSDLLSRNTVKIKSQISHPRTAWVLCRELELSCFSKEIVRWRDVLGEERLYVADMKQLQNPTLIEAIIQWLDLKPLKQRATIAVRNQTIGLRCHSVHRFAKRLKPLIPNRLIGSVASVWYRQLQSTSGVKKSQGDHQALQLLDSYFRDDLKQLQSVLGNELIGWQGRNEFFGIEGT